MTEEKKVISFTTSFPTIHSVLAPDSLLTEVLPLYNLSNVVTCVFLTHGVNDTYLIQADNEKYILRVYSAGLRSLSDILYEIDVLLHLEHNHVPVSTPVAQKNGSYVTIVQAAEGLRQIVLFTYAPGRTLDRHDVTDSYKHGKALAVIHNATDSFVSPHVRASLDLSCLIEQSLHTIEPLLAYTSVDWSYLQSLTERLRFQIERFSLQGLDWGLCHGDCHMLNDHLNADSVITFFDFDCCATGWRAYDLAVIRWSEGFYKMDPDDQLWHAALKGYREERNITETDLASIPTFVALREIWHTALVARFQPILGIQGFDSLLLRTVRLLQEWEETQLR